MKISLGKTEAGAAFELPLEVTVQSVAILAKRGSGKTYTASVLAEGLLEAGQQVIVLDPVGVWWGLKSSADGNAAGFPIFVFGGDQADIPLESTSGKVVARAIVEKGFSAIIDLSHFNQDEFHEFAADFCRTLYLLNREPVHLIVDEADTVAPQKPERGATPVLHAMEAIVRRGRARGIGCTLITQRPQVLNKNVLTQCEVLICLRMVHPKDIGAIKEWIEVHATAAESRDIIRTLATLPVGEAWCWSPGWLELCERIRIRKRTTFDSSATPKPGQTRVVPKAMAPADLKQLNAAILETIEHAKEEDPETLRARISELQLQLAGREPVVDPAELKRAEERSFAEGLEEMRRRISEVLGVTFGTILGALKEPMDCEHPIRLEIPDFQKGMVKAEDYFDFRSVPFQEVQTSAPRSTVANASNPTKLTGGIHRMMIALAQVPRGLNARQIGLRAGLSSKSGTFSTYLGRLRNSGWVAGDRNLLFITQEGLAELGAFQPLPTGRALVDHWIGEIGNGSGAARMLRVLADHFPRALSRDELGAHASISPASGTFSTYLAKLRTLELVEGSKEFRLSEELAA